MINQYLNLDLLSCVMVGVVWTIGTVVMVYSRSFMRLDRAYPRFMLQLVALIFAATILFTTNHVLILVLAWCVANGLLVNLMTHQDKWQAAQASGQLAWRHLMLGTMALGAAMIVLVQSVGSSQITTIVAHSASIPTSTLFVVMPCLLVTVMTQAGLWPFHRWLLSSLNSPTPVSAMMHAGLVNASGYLLVRFAALYFHQALFLDAIFVIGAVSMTVGTAFKLIQSDVKRMLACSTMGQMGFMTLLCGLGLFPVAIVHLVWHALFKANLFLSVNQTLNEVKRHMQPSGLMASFLFLMASVIGLAVYFNVLQLDSAMLDGRSLVAVLFFLMMYQLTALSSQTSVLNKLMVCTSIILLAVFYAEYVKLAEYLLANAVPASYQTLGWLHYIAISTFVLMSMVFARRQDLTRLQWFRRLYDALYVKCLNASQPHSGTVTTSRSTYQF